MDVEALLEYYDSQEVMSHSKSKATSRVQKALTCLVVGLSCAVTLSAAVLATKTYENLKYPPVLYEAYKQLSLDLVHVVQKRDLELKQLSSQLPLPAREDSLRGLSYQVRQYPLELDSLDAELGEKVVYIDKNKQLVQVWERTNFSLLEETLCSTGLNPGEKERQGDMKTPSGPFTLESVEPSDTWLYEGKSGMYGPYFFRMNVGAWDVLGKHYPSKKSSIGIHGTSEEEYLGTRRSHSCIRIPNAALLKFKEKGYLSVGVKGMVGKD